MTVLVEGISVIVRVAAITEKFPGGLAAFQAVVPNRTFCADSSLARVGFMTPKDVEAFVAHLERRGLSFVREGRAADLAVVDQMRGPTTSVDWLEFDRVELAAGRRVAVCRASGQVDEPVTTPTGWKFENSLSCTYSFVPTGYLDKVARFLRKEAGGEIYWDELAGAEMFVGRALVN